MSNAASRKKFEELAKSRSEPKLLHAPRDPGVLQARLPALPTEFVMVTLLSRWQLGEEVTPLRWAGVGLILVGTSLIVAQA